MKNFIASGKKIDSTILRRSCVRTDKRSGVATATEKVSGGSNALTSKVNNNGAVPNAQPHKQKPTEKKVSDKKNSKDKKKQQTLPADKVQQA